MAFFCLTVPFKVNGIDFKLPWNYMVYYHIHTHTHTYAEMHMYI